MYIYMYMYIHVLHMSTPVAYMYIHICTYCTFNPDVYYMYTCIQRNDQFRGKHENSVKEAGELLESYSVGITST